MTTGKAVAKGLVLKRIEIAKSSSVYKSNNKFETCPITFVGKRRI
jgi:hypothetical protein